MTAASDICDNLKCKTPDLYRSGVLHLVYSALIM